METLANLLRESAASWGSLPAVALHDAQSWSGSYARVRDAARRPAGAMASGGIVRGDRVVFWSGNRPEWVAAFFGAQMLGASVIPLDVRSREDLLQRIEEQTQPKHLFLGREQAASLTATHPPHTLLEDL